MVVNTQQLQYLVEIQRTGSISHAAANLYMSQPNLSRVLRDIETTLGYPIFERTRKGVRPTQRGEKFLHHARNILRETAYMEQLGTDASVPHRLRVCIPRSPVYAGVIQSLLCRTDHSLGLQAHIRECHPRRALELVLEGSAEVAVLRYLESYQDYFTEQASAHRLEFLPLGKREYQLLVHRESPLAREDAISPETLLSYTELVHREEPAALHSGSEASRFIHTVDRMTRLQLLRSIPTTYLWSEPLPEAFLSENCLIQVPCPGNSPVYCEALIYNPQSALSPLEKSFIGQLCASSGEATGISNP